MTRRAKRGIQFAVLWISALVPLSAVQAHAENPPGAFRGGIAQAAGALHLELVTEEGVLRLYVYDRHNAPISLDGVTASALVWFDKGSAAVKMSPDGTALSADAVTRPDRIVRVAVEVRVPGRESANVWFNDLSRLKSQPSTRGPHE